MAKLRSLLFIGLISVCTLVGRAQQSPPPIAGAPNITWGMTPDQVQEFAPGQLEGQMLIYNQEFWGYPAIGQYYFEQNALYYVMFTPHYRYDDATQWTPEVRHIQNELTTLYGQPVTTQPMQWQSDQTLATLMLMQQGWLTRFDRRDGQ